MKYWDLSIIAFIFCTNSVLPQDQPSKNKPETVTYNCIVQQFQQNGLAIEKELLGFENYLSKNTFLKKNSNKGIKDTSNVLVTLKIDPRVATGFLSEIKKLLLDMGLKKIIFY